MPSSAPAHIFLKLNSQFSALNGTALMLAPALIAPILFSNPIEWAALGLRGLGFGLLCFALFLYLLSKNKFVSRSMVNEVVVLDALWVVGSVVLVAFFASLFTTHGIIVVSVVALVVAFLAVAQFAAAAKIQNPIPVARVEARDGQIRATVRRIVKAPTDTVWEVMTDHPAYADVAGNISKVEVLSGDGLGMTRRCFGPKGESWTETCDHYEPGHSYGFRIHTEAKDYPYPFLKLSGRWSVNQHTAGSEFDIEIVATLKGSTASKWMFAAIAKPQFTVIMIDLADAWAARMEKEAGRADEGKHSG